jgi:CheY-like chemotaxis protein
MQNDIVCFLVDNDEDDQEIFETAIREINASIKMVTARNGIEAMKLLADPGFLPSVIFLDLNMPLMNGKQCLYEIRKILRLDKVPVYLYSTAVNPQMLQEVKNSGATDVFVKPSSFTGLVNLLSPLFKKRAIS